MELERVATCFVIRDAARDEKELHALRVRRQRLNFSFELGRSIMRQLYMFNSFTSRLGHGVQHSQDVESQTPY